MVAIEHACRKPIIGWNWLVSFLIKIFFISQQKDQQPPPSKWWSLCQPKYVTYAAVVFRLILILTSVLVNEQTNMVCRIDYIVLHCLYVCSFFLSVSPTCMSILIAFCDFVQFFYVFQLDSSCNSSCHESDRSWFRFCNGRCYGGIFGVKLFSRHLCDSGIEWWRDNIFGLCRVPFWTGLLRLLRFDFRFCFWPYIPTPTYL